MELYGDVSAHVECALGEKPEYEKYRPNVWRQEAFEDDGFVQPYCDTPLDNETVGENVYLNIINRAKKYVYILRRI